MSHRKIWIVILAGAVVCGVRAAGPAAGDRPAITFNVKSVPYEQRSQVRDFVVHVRFPEKPATAPSVELTLDVGRGEPRTFAALPADSNGAYSLAAPLVPEYLHPRRLHIAARYLSGSVNCNIEDSDLDLNGRTIMLADIRRFAGGKSPRIELASGEVLHAIPTGLQYMRADLGPVAVTLNLAKAEEFSVEFGAATPDAVHYRIAVTEAEQVVAEQSGIIRVIGAPASEPATSQ